MVGNLFRWARHVMFFLACPLRGPWDLTLRSRSVVLCLVLVIWPHSCSGPFLAMHRKLLLCATRGCKKRKKKKGKCATRWCKKTKEKENIGRSGTV